MHACRSTLEDPTAGTGTESVLDRVATELVAHMIIEETLFYPAVRSIDPKLVLEGFEEHVLAQLSLKRLLHAARGSDVFRARATTLKELIDHHAIEEEDMLFPAVEKSLDPGEHLALGAKMKAKFDELVALGWEVTLPKGEGKTTVDERELVGRVTDGSNPDF